jgi:hypothetical protein
MPRERPLPKPVADAIGAYYEHRRAQKTARWDKTADLRAIDEACKAAGIGFAAIAGTFCLYRRAVRWKVTEAATESWVERKKGSPDWRLTGR